MLKLTVAALALALAGSASAAGWRSLRIDASSAASFQESVAALQDKLSPSRRVAFSRSLQDVWIVGTNHATAQQREYTSADYLRQLDGLGYQDVIKLTDPTSEKEGKYRSEFYYARGAGRAGVPTIWYPGDPRRYPKDPPPVQSGAYRGLPPSP